MLPVLGLPFNLVVCFSVLPLRPVSRCLASRRTSSVLPYRGSSVLARLRDRFVRPSPQRSARRSASRFTGARPARELHHSLGPPHRPTLPAHLWILVIPTALQLDQQFLLLGVTNTVLHLALLYPLLGLTHMVPHLAQLFPCHLKMILSVRQQDQPSRQPKVTLMAPPLPSQSAPHLVAQFLSQRLMVSSRQTLQI